MLLREPQFSHLISRGIPSPLRGEMWQNLCGSAVKKEKSIFIFPPPLDFFFSFFFFFFFFFSNKGLYQYLVRKHRGVESQVCHYYRHYYDYLQLSLFSLLFFSFYLIFIFF